MPCSLPRLLLWSTLLAACAGRDAADQPAADQSAADAPVAGETVPAASAALAQPVNQPLTVADIQRWEKGVAGEMAAVRQAAERMKGAKSGEDSVSAMMGLQEMATVPEGARAAGLDEERYRFVRSTISSAIAALTPPELEGMDTTQMPQGMRDELRQGRESQLKQMGDVVPEEVLKELRPRAAELRKKDLELVGARLKAAGA